MTFDSRGPRPPMQLPGSEEQTGSLPSAVWQLAAPAAAPGGEAPGMYQFRAVVGRGGYGEVWEAVQVALNRTVAVKRLHLEAASPAETTALEELFRHEAFTTAALDHPNIVPVYDFGIGEDRRPMLAMKLVRGRNWRQEIARDFQALSPADFLGRHLRILSDVTQAVVFAHAAGIVHRDLKPGQVMLGEFGEVLLMDWGLAVQVDPTAGAPSGAAVDRRVMAPRADAASSPAGTPGYMAPEQTLGSAAGVGTWTDVYLLGGILYTLLTGTPPHQAETAEASFLKAQAGVPENPRLRAPGRAMPDDLVRLVMTAMDPDPVRRVPGASEFLRLLQEHMTGASRRGESVSLTRQLQARAAPLPRDYEALTELVNEVGRARLLWPENPEALALRDALLAAQADLAIRGGDLLLARVTLERLTDESTRNRLKAELRAAEVARERQRREHLAFRLATAALLLVILGGGSWFIARLSTAREVADQAKVRADGSRERAEDLLSFMIEDLQAKLEPVGRLDVLDAVSTKAQSYLDSLPADEDDEAAVSARLQTRARLALIRSARGDQRGALQALDDLAAGLPEAVTTGTLSLVRGAATAQVFLARGEVRGRMGLPGPADEDLLRAEAYYAWLDASEPRNPAWMHALIRSMSEREENCHARARYAEALEIAKTMQQLLGRKLQAPGADRTLERDFAVSVRREAKSAAFLDQHREAVERVSHSIGILDKLAGAEPRDAGLKHELSEAWTVKGDAHLQLKEYPENLAAQSRAEELAREAADRDPANLALRDWHALMLAQVGRAHRLNGQPAVARRGLEQAVEILRGDIAMDPTNMTARRNLLQASDWFGDLLDEEQRYSESGAIRCLGADAILEVVDRDPTVAEYQELLLRANTDLVRTGGKLLLGPRIHETPLCFQTSLRVTSALLRLNPGVLARHEEFAKSLVGACGGLIEVGELPAADELIATNLATLEASSARFPENSMLVGCLMTTLLQKGSLARELGDDSQAESDWLKAKEAYGRLRKLGEPGAKDSFLVGGTMVAWLGSLHLAHGDKVGARQYLEEAKRIFADPSNDMHSPGSLAMQPLVNSVRDLFEARVLRAEGRDREAVELLERVVARLTPLEKGGLSRVREPLAAALLVLGCREEAMPVIERYATRGYVSRTLQQLLRETEP